MLNLSQRFLIILIINIINLILIFGVNDQNTNYDVVQDFKIIDNSELDSRKFYFITAIIYRVSYTSINNVEMLGCAGSLLTPKNVLTTANCVVNRRYRDIFVRAGSLEWNNGGYISDVKKIFIHEQFDNETLNYDIAYLYLYKDGFEDAIQKTTLIRIIELPDQPIKSNMAAFEAGWGTLNRSREISNRLRQSTVQILSYSKCRQIFGKDITTKMICGASEILNNCVGDSGGPLINNNSTLIGLITKGESCKGEENPGIYTDIYELLHWIRTVPEKVEQQVRSRAHSVNTTKITSKTNRTKSN